jgi:hypothetical protein
MRRGAGPKATALNYVPRWDDYSDEFLSFEML